jgi:ABC-type branched-subunit amino acid transport system ATPase component/predicted MFS family arabinose efflux permease
MKRLREYMSGEGLFPIVVLFLLNAVDEFDSRTFDLLGPEITDHFNISISRFGVITIIGVLLVPFVAVAVSYAADRWRRMPLAIAGAAAWGAFSIGTGLAPSLALLIVMRIGSGFGKTVNEGVHGGLIAEFYSPKTRVKAFGVHSLANPAGVLFASAIAGFIADAYGFRAPFFVLSIGTIVVLIISLRLREPERGRFEVVEAPQTPPLLETARRLWAVRSLRYQWIGNAFTTGAVLGVGTLVPFYLYEEFGLRAGLRGLYLGIGSAISMPAIVYGTSIAQRYVNREPRMGLRLMCWTGLAAGACMFGMAVAPGLPLALLFLWSVIAIFAFVAPTLRAITALVAPPEIRSSAFALAGLIAISGAPFALIGYAIADANGMRWGIVAIIPIFVRGVMYFFKAADYFDDDVERLDPARASRAKESGALGPILLETRGLTVSFDGVKVLFGVDLEIRRGEMVALLGTNGAGKSTTLNAISGIVEPDGGNVWFDGEAITGEVPERTAARGIIQVPGGRGVFPGLTVEENLKMGCFMIRRDTDLVAERMAEVLELFPRLAERMGQRAGSLSGGERQMLTLAQSFVLKPKLLLIDELSLGLAPALVRELLQAVRKMNESGITIVVVEQSVNIALTLADRAYFMEKGEVRFSGKTSELLARRDLLRSVFLEGAGKRR